MAAADLAALTRAFAAGRFAEVAKTCAAALETEPRNRDLLHLRGLALFRLGDRKQALAMLEQAATLLPADAAIIGNLGRVLAADGAFSHAADCFGRALALAPRSILDQEDLGTALCCLERYDEGAAAYEGALALEPGRVSALLKLARARLQQGRFEEGLALVERAERAEPRLGPRAAGLRGFAFLRQGRYVEAERDYGVAIAGGEASSETRMGRARARARLGNLAGAAEDLQAAAREPAAAFDAELELATIAGRRGDEADAARHFAAALALRPRSFRARWQQAMGFPLLWSSVDEMAEARALWNRQLAEIEAELDLARPEAVLDAALAIQSVANFHLHYQGADDRPEQERYGRILARVAAARHPRHAEPPRRREGPPRVGFLSAHLRRHSIWKTHAAWITGTRGDFRKHVYQASRDFDPGFTDRVRDAADKFLQTSDMERLIAAIAADELDLLIYLDHGMATELQLPAALPLAPAQANGLGHPVTSGLPSFTHALTSALAEPPGGERYYTERLARLAGSASAYEWRRIAELLDALPAPEPAPAGKVRYLCAQNLIKYLPQHDRIFAAIAAELPDAEFHFLGGSAPEIAAFRRRLGAAFAARKLDPGRSVFCHGPLDPSAYMALNQACDVFLDSIGWSGNNTTHEAIAAGLPVLTLPGPQMRGRHALALLTMMELTETVARDEADFVALAVRAGREREWRRYLAAQTAARRHAIYDDPAPLRDLERFIERTIAETRGG